MIQVCYYCHEVYGEKEPLTNREETSGECPLCHFLFAFWYRLWKTGAIKETATEFILACRQLLNDNNQKLTYLNEVIS